MTAGTVTDRIVTGRFRFGGAVVAAGVALMSLATGASAEPDASAVPAMAGPDGQGERQGAGQGAAADPGLPPVETSPLVILRDCEAPMFVDCFRLSEKRTAEPDRPAAEGRADSAPEQAKAAAPDRQVRARPDPVPKPAERRSTSEPEPGSVPIEPELKALLDQVDALGLDYRLPERYAAPGP